MPSEASLEKQQYYGHARNLFWVFMGELFDFDHSIEYQQRTQHLIEQGVAVWDVIEKCHREGSLDSAIESDSIQANDFVQLFADYPTIRNIFFNGAKAETEFRKRVMPLLKESAENYQFELLPSTSPANAGMTKAEKLVRWKKVKTVLQTKK